MIDGIGHDDFNYQANRVCQRSSDIRFLDPSVMSSQEKQLEIINSSGSLSDHYQESAYHYKSATTVWNLNKILRKCGIPVPTKYCSRMWCVKDIVGYTAAGFSWTFVIVGEFLIIMNCLSSHRNIYVTTINIILTFILAMLAFISHCKCMFSDPGTLPRGTATEENIARLDFSDGRQILKCVKCDSIKPDRAHHCSVCKRCIRKMDHHCPWINNCVGEYNQKYFVLFTGYVCIMSCYGFVVSITTLIVCITSTLEGCYFSMTASLVMSICLLTESLMFGLFTAIMFGTQVCSICKDETGIESLKKENRKRMTCKTSLREVFGGKFSYRWFSPFHNNVESRLHVDETDSV